MQRTLARILQYPPFTMSILRTKVRGTSWSFGSLYEVMAKANAPKSGDRLAGLSADTTQERIAARQILSDLPLSLFLEQPAVPSERDEVTRILLDRIDPAAWSEIKGWSVGELREKILAADGPTALRWGLGLPSEAIAAVAKLMSNLDLVSAAAKIPVDVRCRTRLGGAGILSSRLQPNHPTDDLAGILASLREGLSYACGDAMVGINPADDSVGAVRHTADGVSEHVHDILGVPTQVCVLAHATTQMEVLRQGGRLDLVFQSLAGTEDGCKSFGISGQLLSDARACQKELRPELEQVMYFETGQGSELSAGAHHGIDQLTLESRCYGLARAYDPFLVNTVVGFIGPEYLADGREVARAGLEDHFMGKLHGLPMGVDVCYTNHMDADQNDMENLAVLLTAAGCTFFMGVPLGDDVMLNYQTTSFHDLASLRETLGRRTAPEFEAWMEKEGILSNGRLTDLAGDPTLFESRRRYS
jgi:ethanolamine ammonia-lyase large subunit